ncbi:Glycosyl hydrolases family 2, TIM barrel domain [Luteibacter sp. UNC138MFCol5.1]|nr:Glycosyl hydrolases family 2, TIM barrel domain [Luteibacter sp. UNC138MFCol5.1]
MKRHPASPPRPRRTRLSALFSVAFLGVTATAQAVTLAPSDRQDINLGAQPWKYTKQAIKNPNDPVVYAPLPNGDDGAAVNFDDSKWLTVGLPHAANDFTTFINQESGGGQGSLDGETSWYRTTLADSASYRGKKVMVEFEGAHTGDRVYINGRFIPGTGVLNQAGQVDAQATHVIGFVPHIVDLTPFLKFDGTDVLAVKVARGGGFFEDPGFSGSFRFGQAESGIFRPVKLHVTNFVHIPENVYAGQNTWGTYVGTQAISADHKQATIRVQTNVVNETAAAQEVTLTTQIVDANGNVVATDQKQATLAPHVIPGDEKPVFDETLTVNNPTLWYPNNSLDGKPYMYKVLHTVSIDGTVVDAKQSTLGIRTITWDKDFPYVNGKKQYTWGGSGRYDYPGLGSSVPEEQQWRDLRDLAAAGGNLWRPGHSPSSPEFVEAADALGVFIVQPSGDGENGFADPCKAGDTQCANMWTIKREVHRDIVIRDRSHPSILAWEHNNGVMYTPFAQELRTLARNWDSIAPRAAADRTPNAANGDILSCSKAGCETNLHQTTPNKPAWGAEYWGDGVLRHSYDLELAFALNYLVPYSEARKAGTFGMAQWYFADTPGETVELADGLEDDTHWVYGYKNGAIDHNADGTPVKQFRHNARGNNASMTDANRFPRMLYYIYQSVWVPYDLRPVVKLANHWNLTGNITVSAFSNCPKVRLLINGVPQGNDQTPNPWDTIDKVSQDAENGPRDTRTGRIVGADVAQKTTKLPGQVHWDVTWQAGTAVAQCIDTVGNVRKDANGLDVADTLTTAGTADHIELEVVNTKDPIVRPDGSAFQITANGSDAAFIVARVVDKNGNWVPTASQKVTFDVDSGASLVTFNGGTQQYVDYSAGEVPDQGGGIAEPIHSYHSPGSHELQFEGGLQKIALRTKFTTGTVTVSASAPGLVAGHTSFTIQSVPKAPTTSGPPSVIANPVDDNVTVGDTGHFSVTASGAPPLTFTWKKNGVEIPGATTASYTTPATTLADNGAVYTVVVHGQGPDQESTPARLGVFAFSPVVISAQPASQNVDAGQSARFAVTASGSPKVKYQWYVDGVAIPNATSTSYETGTLSTADNAKKFEVLVSNSNSQQKSNVATLTVNAARPPVLTGNLADVRANPGQPATFDASNIVAGTTPYHYKWSHDGQPVGDDLPTLTIGAVQLSDVGSYSVTVSNIVDGATVTATAKLTLAPPGANLARQKQTLSTEVENVQGTPAWAAVDGDATTRWASKQKVDDAYITVDLGSSRTFNRVVLKWENAHATEYKIQYSDNPDSGFKDAYHNTASVGGTEDVTFEAPVTGRYVRMQGVKRSTDYGYSLYEFEVYNSAGCCGASERYTTTSGSKFVTDTLSGLVWDRVQRGYQDQGAQFTQSVAITECAKDSMRLPTVAEALAISGQNYSTAAFPGAWTTWTEGKDPTDATYAFVVSSLGVKSRAVAENNPGHVLCVKGTKVVAPAITAQPANQKAGVGRSAHFAVTASGVGPLSYDWYNVSKDADGLDVETLLSSTADGTYATPALVAANNGARLRVKVVSAQGLSTTSDDTFLTVDNSDAGFDPVFGAPVAQQPGQPGDGDNGGDNGGGNPPSPGTPGDGKGGVNIALGAKTTSHVDPERGDLDASMATDGKFDTRWSSKGKVDPTDLVVDFGTAKTFDHVIMRWENAASAKYTIDVSNDGESWQTVAGPITGKGGVDTQTFAVQTARFVRMNSTARTTDYGNSLWEFEVYQAAAPQQPEKGDQDAGEPQQPDHAVPSTGNLALKRAVVASDTENAVAFKADNANDGDGGSRWSSAFSDDQWIQVDLGSVKTIGKVVLSWENAHALAYRIDVSIDGKTWNVAYDEENSQGGIETVTFPAVSARYVRMQGLKRSSAYGYSLWEMGVYAASGDGDTGTQPGNPGANDPAQGFDYVTYPGYIGTQLRNTTNGKWRDDQIFVAVIGRDPASKVFSWVKPDGTLIAASETDNDATGHLTKNGQNYSNYFFTLAQAKLLKLPKMDSGRIFVSVGEPMYIKILKAADGSIGFAGPNPLNATDPNIGVYYDWYEFTWNDNAIFINTTQVDQFSIPLSLDVFGGNKSRHESSGITQTRAQIFAQYNQEVPAEFQLAEADPIRILAPGKAAFDAGKPQEHYFDAYIDQSWAYYENHVLQMTIGAKQFEGTVVDGVLTFVHTNWAQTKEPDEAEGMLFKVEKPTTQAVLEGKDQLARSHDPWGVEGQLEAQICAAFNRHVMEDTSSWKDPGAFYQQSPANYYSRFWHLHGVNGKAYGFAYDDVSDQSSTLIETQPEHLELGIGW